MNKKIISVAIATTSEDKIQGIKQALQKYYREDEYDIEIYSGKTKSDVSEQPFGNETYQGAYNRVNKIKEKYQQKLDENQINIDYYISCEAGIDNTNNVIENGIVKTLYVSEQIVCIYNPKKDIYSFGKSSSWVIPSSDIEEIKNTSLDAYLRKRGCKGLQDIGEGKYINRTEAVEEAMLAAVASEKFLDKCKEIEENKEEVK